MQSLEDVGKRAVLGSVSTCSVFLVMGELRGWPVACHGHGVVCFPPTRVFLESVFFHLLVRVSAMGCQPGFPAGSHYEIMPSVATRGNLQPGLGEEPLLCSN